MNRFEFFINQYGIDYVGNGCLEVAKIVDRFTEKEYKVFYIKNAYKLYGYHMGTDGSRVVVDDVYKTLLYQKTDIFEALLMHEIGHILKGHFSNMGFKSHQEIVKNRTQLAKDGRVMESELEADQFAATHVGLDTTIQALQYMIGLRKLRGDNGASTAIKEMENRIKALKTKHI